VCNGTAKHELPSRYETEPMAWSGAPPFLQFRAFDHAGSGPARRDSETVMRDLPIEATLVDGWWIEDAERPPESLSPQDD